MQLGLIMEWIPIWLQTWGGVGGREMVVVVVVVQRWKLSCTPNELIESIYRKELVQTVNTKLE